MQIKQLVPSNICLDCDVCCRFTESKSPWSPFFTKKEITNLVEKDILPPMLFSGHSYQGEHINLLEYKGCFICPCFTPGDHNCKIYLNRPFECVLYPFILIKSKNKFYLAMDKKCPYFTQVKKEELDDYIDYLKKEFSKKTAEDYFKENVELFAEYPLQDLEILFPICIHE